MRGFNTELNSRAPEQWITNQINTIRSELVFYQNPKDSRLIDGEKIGD
jgi:hypothetical protein